MTRGRLQALVLSLAAGFSGCYSHSLRDAPNPEFKQVQMGEGWNQYVSQLYEHCEQRTYQSIDMDERMFELYFYWLNTLTGKQFALENFNIVSDNALYAFFDVGPLSFFPTDSIFWYGMINTRNRSICLQNIAHEYGHFTDAHLDYADYIFDRRSEIRIEAVAEAFEHYVGLELIKTGNIEGKDNLICFPDQEGKYTRAVPLGIEEYKTLDDILELNRYASAQCLALILMNEFREMGRVWYYLSINDKDTVFQKLEKIVLDKGEIAVAIQSGADITYQEKSVLLQQYAHR